MSYLVLSNNTLLAQDEITLKFSYRYFNSDGFSFPYRLFTPENYDSIIMYPIVLTLHGAGESGTDNEIQIEVNHIATCWADSAFQSNHPCFIVSPQSTGGWNFPSVVDMVDSLIAEFNIDTNRIYITGLSMGGNGTWWYIDNYPDYFAAAIPVCGWWTNYLDRVESVRHIPVWNHHGDRDNTVPTSNSRNIFNAYSKAGLPIVFPDRQKYFKPKITEETKNHILTDDIDYIYSEHKGVDHFAWNYAYTDLMVLEWLFSKRKRINGIINFSESSNNTTLDSIHVFYIDCDVDNLVFTLSYSSNLGYMWENILDYSSNSDSIIINTSQLSDSPLGQFRIQLKDNDSNILGTDYSGYYIVDNMENFKPWLNYYTSSRNLRLIDDSYLELLFNVNDVDDELLELTIYYKHDDSVEYNLIQTEELYASNDDQPVNVYFDDLPYGNKAKLKFILTDGENITIDSTDYFKNPNNEPGQENILSLNNSEFRIYPNPVSEMLNIEINTYNESKNNCIYLIDINGKIVLKKNIDKRKIQVQLNDIHPGIYFIKVFNETRYIGIKKVIIK